MEKLERMGFAIGIIGGLGLGFLLGSEYSGRHMTLLGAGLLIISLFCLGMLSYKKKKG